MNKTMKELQDLKPGDYVRWNSADWEITDRDLYKESADYSEVQWVLTPRSGPDNYLVRSQEKKADGVEEIWVCTHQVKVSGVEYLVPSEGWRRFKGTDSVPAPPDLVRHNGIELHLDGTTEGLAEDDDGNTVTKLTWDYYDPTGKRNLAIEVWKEPDADYFEAYDGRVVAPSEFLPIPPPAGKKRRKHGGGVSDTGSPMGCLLTGSAFAAVALIPIGGAILNTADTGAEYLVPLLLLGFFTAYFLVKEAKPAAVFLALAGSLLAAILALAVRGLGGPYWEYSLYGVLLGAGLAKVSEKFLGGVTGPDKTAAASLGTLLFLLIVGFAHYVKYAPRPHGIGMLLAACALPMAPAVLIYLAYRFIEGSNEQA